MAEAEKVLREAMAGDDTRRLEDAIRRAKALKVEAEPVTAAEQRLAEVRAQKAREAATLALQQALGGGDVGALEGVIRRAKESTVDEQLVTAAEVQ